MNKPIGKGYIHLLYVTVTKYIMLDAYEEKRFVQFTVWEAGSL